MTQVTLKGTPVETVGVLPIQGAQAQDFTLTASDLSDMKLLDFRGKKVILNIFPSIDTGTCAMSVRTFNEKASHLENTTVLCVSADLPFAHSRFCGAEGIENVKIASSFRSSFGQDYGLSFSTGPLRGLLSRAVIVLDESGKVLYTEQVAEIVNEPNYEAALSVV
jgi:thiol peroxidase